MALFWEPKWVRKTINYEGIELEVCFDEESKLFLCPVCNNPERYCPGDSPTNIVSEDLVTFFTLDDLIRHLRTHAHKIFESRKIVTTQSVREEKE